MGADDLGEVAAELDVIAERLADLALDRLRAAVGDDGERDVGSAAAEERRITRARRAVEKASALLAAPARSEDDDGGD